jgi:hypothetical protein
MFDLRWWGIVVDGRLREYTLGPPQEITDRLFVVRRAFRVNDSLAQDSASPAPGSGGPCYLTSRKLLYRNSPLLFRRQLAPGLLAYCGVSDEGTKPHAVVA